MNPVLTPFNSKMTNTHLSVAVATVVIMVVGGRSGLFAPPTLPRGGLTVLSVIRGRGLLVVFGGLGVAVMTASGTPPGLRGGMAFGHGQRGLCLWGVSRPKRDQCLSGVGTRGRESSGS